MPRAPLALLAATLAAALAPSLAGEPAAAQRAVTMPPVGLSIEYSTMAQDLGTGECAPQALVAELRKLGSPPLALGGLSQDLTAPSGAQSAQPTSWQTATLYPLPPDFWIRLHCLLAAAGDPLTAGVNAKTGELAWDAQTVAGAQTAATSGLDFSLGNEPDVYELPDYSALGRPQLGEDVAAVNVYLQVAADLRAALGALPLIGPELATAAHWRGQLPRVISTLGLRTVGVHVYPLTACKGERPATVKALLSPRAADAAGRLGWVVADADAAGVPAIVSEANSVSCGGLEGVSDGPAAAVWAVRFVLAALDTGFREVRFHFSGGPYDPFLLSGGQIVARPLESALVALNRWLPVGSALATADGAKGVLTTTVVGVAGRTELILDNERARAQKVTLPATRTLLIERLGPLAAGLRTSIAVPRRGRVKLELPANSLATVLPEP